MHANHDVTQLLHAAHGGDQEALNRLFPLVYEELHRRAHQQRYRWHGNDTLNTTALVHETYLKLINQGEVRWNSRAHFFAVAAKAMRHILINYAERQQAAKRGGNHTKLPADGVPLVADDAIDELVALNDALERLEQVSERQCRVVECRFFAGLPIEETATALDISPATVKRDWQQASAWLYRALSEAA